MSRLGSAASRHTQPPKDAERIYQNGARGHRCFEASTITIAGELLLLQSAVLYWVQIFFSCLNLLYTVLLLLFVKNKTKKKIKQTPNFSKGSFLPLQQKDQGDMFAVCSIWLTTERFFVSPFLSTVHLQYKQS